MPGAPTHESGYLHAAVLYDSDEEFIGVVVPFLQERAAVGGPCLVALGASTTDPTAPSTLPVEAPQPATPQRETPPLDAVEHLVFAVSEVVTNALIHGRPPVRFRLWTAPDRIVATVTDRGDGPADPFAGLLPVTDTCSAGLGLWLTHQLCRHVTLDTTDDGFTIRLILGTPQPGRSGHAPDNA